MGIAVAGTHQKKDCALAQISLKPVLAEDFHAAVQLGGMQQPAEFIDKARYQFVALGLTGKHQRHK